jgi:MFS family permease
MYLFVGALIYVAMYYVATTTRSYWGFVGMMLVQGFMAGSQSIAIIYYTDIYSKETDRNNWSGIMMSVMILLATLGALVGGSFKKVGLFHGGTSIIFSVAKYLH